MSESAEEHFHSRPAPYPKTSTPEIDSRDIFHGLLNRQFVKGDINVLDKVPNWDGILELTDEDGYSEGKVEVQLKTLNDEFANSPKYQCKRSFFGYCQNAALPVLLVVVDRRSRKAYWRHIDATTLLEVKQNIEGESYLLSIPTENCLDGLNQEYISQWSLRAKEASTKVWNFDSEAKKRKELEEELREINGKLQTPVNLPSHALKEILEFLDEYNYILDKEFGSVKQVLYPYYWKIGMGVIKYEFGDIRFFLYPVEYDKSQLLIKEVEPGYDYLGKEMLEGNVLMWTAMKDNENLTRNRVSYCYKLLDDEIMRIAGKYNFPLADLYLANEYLISFIDQFQQYLNLDKYQETYSLKDLKYMLYSVIPMLVATNHSFADWVTNIDHNIDTYDSYRAGEGHKKRITEAIAKINQGFRPKVSVTVVSQRYNIELIHYYIGLLQSKGFSVTKRKYKHDQRDERIYNVPLWKTWNKEVLWFNLHQFFQQFYRLYNDYIGVHFSNIYHHLKIVESDEITIVHILHFDEKRIIPPHMEVYHLRPAIPGQGRVLTFLAEDPNNPIVRRKYFLDRKFDCVIEDNRYEIILMHGQPLDFMFADSPSYSLINEKLTNVLQRFFRERQS